MERSIRSMASATAGTGTLAEPFPAAPFAAMATFHDPGAMSHTAPVKKLGSDDERFSASDVGGCLLASPTMGTGVMRSASGAAPETRTSTTATPGITSGGRTVT